MWISLTAGFCDSESRKQGLSTWHLEPVRIISFVGLFWCYIFACIPGLDLYRTRKQSNNQGRLANLDHKSIVVYDRRKEGMSMIDKWFGLYMPFQTLLEPPVKGILFNPRLGAEHCGLGLFCRRILVCLGVMVLLCWSFAWAEDVIQKEWTVLIYMNGKNDLEEFAIEDFRELAKVGSTQDVNFVVQLGRPERRPGAQAEMRSVFGGWSGARRFYVVKDATPEPGNEIEIVDSGHVDMGAAETLTNFLKWGKDMFPAKRYAVVIWNHGQGYRLQFNKGAVAARTEPASERIYHGDAGRSHRAVSQDIDTGAIIYNAELRSSIKSVFGNQLSVVGFDACLMAMIETAYELKDVAEVMVASEELEPGNGWNYTSVASYLTNDPNSDGEQFAANIVRSYRETYGDNDSTTLSALRLKDINSLAQEVSALSDGLLSDQKRYFPIVKSSRAERAAYNDPHNPVTIDLVGFLNALEGKLEIAAPDQSVLAHVRRARELAASLVITNYASSTRLEPYGSYGIAIYFPASKAAFHRDSWSDGYLRSNEFKRIDFVVSERWSSLLQAYLGLPL